MSKITRILVVPLAVLALAALGAVLLVATSPSIETVAPERALTTVRTIVPKPQDIRLQVRSQGTVAPRTESAVVPEVSGRITWISPALVSGGFFSEGDKLLEIEPRDYEMAVQRARAALTRADSEREFAAAELKRQEGLSARAVASTAQLSQARRTGRVADASFDEASIALEQAERDLARTQIFAPFEGRVREKQVDVGQFVSRGAPVATIYATDYAEIRLPIADRQFAFLRLPSLRNPEAGAGPKVRILSDFGGRRHEWTGQVVRTEGEIDARSRMVHVVARVEHPYDAPEDEPDKPPLAVGLFVHAEIEGPVVENVIVVPRYAMRDDAHILVVDSDERLRTREVEVLRIDRDDVLIRATLEPGDRLCVSPLQVVVEGMPVNAMADDFEGARS
ncbi:MAG: efflux RND transporter periplasmic adaptor subunit [Deltaproteobacteria bacterium]|nr:efflux RND transporter periplasmic adaptor subunit [Deltaproteobacteria bacterium]MBW2417784.1 efflux RND transporter periplasmic adaptor subunit [Deltaproteobacteria bacterium]